MCPLTVELVKALAWPVAAVLAALAFYQPLSRLFEAIGTRATKFSLFKVEVELVSRAQATPGPSLDNIRNPEYALIGDSGPVLFQQVQEDKPADYAVIDIGDGNEWLTSRLFIGATMLERMRGLKCVVFIGRVGQIDRRLLAVASAARVRWALAQEYPWLEAAFAFAYAEQQPNVLQASLPQHIADIVPTQRTITSLTGGIEPPKANNLVRRFIEYVENPAGMSGIDWVDLGHGRVERAAWVSDTLLRQWLPDEAFESWVYEDRSKPRAERTRAVLRTKGPFVALVNPDRQFTRLIDRGALMEEIVSKMDD